MTSTQIRDLHELFLSDPSGTDLSPLRPVVARSWMRSVAYGVDPELRQFDAMSKVELDERILRYADPVLTDLERLCEDTGMAISMVDANGTLGAFRGDADVRRWAERTFAIPGCVMSERAIGTNSDGTALEEDREVQIWGPEHFAQQLHDCCCATAPIWDPTGLSVKALLSLTLPWSAASHVDPRSVVSIVRGATVEIARLLADDIAIREQALLSAYLREMRKRGAKEVVVMDDRTTIASKGATHILEQSDYPQLSELARECERLGRPVERDITMGAGTTFRMRARPILEAGDAIGSVIRPRSPKRAASPKPRRARSNRRDLFDAFAGKSLALTRTLSVAHTVLGRRIPASITGERGTGKTMLAETMAASLTSNVIRLDCARYDYDGDAYELLESISSALERNGAVVVTHVELASPDLRAELGERFAAHESKSIFLTSASDERGSRLGLSILPTPVELAMPPLRSRRADIPELVSRFLAEGNYGIDGVTSDLMTALIGTDWPGNIGQLKEFIGRAAKRCTTGELGLEHVGNLHRQRLARNPLSPLEEGELQLLRTALIESGGNRKCAAELLKIDRSTLYRKINTFSGAGFSLEPSLYYSQGPSR
ncbi:MAG: hypothetical protein JST53_02890 [Actinobacteria bacterium]|nr:hypothetical protein [Actinomycetota bacterium]